MSVHSTAVLHCKQALWQQWKASSKALLSTWASSGAVDGIDAEALRWGHDDSLVSSVSRVVIADLESREASDSEGVRAAVASGFRLAVDAMEAMFHATGSLEASDEAVVVAPEPSQQSAQPVVVPTGSVSEHNNAAATFADPPPLASSDATTQVETLSGIVLSTHVLVKCAMRRRLHCLERRVAELVSEREELGRELIRVTTSSRLMPSLLMHPSHLTIDVQRLPTSGDRRRHKASKLIWSMISTWQRLSREERSQAGEGDMRRYPSCEGDPLGAVTLGGDEGTPSCRRESRLETRLCSSTFELLNGWLGAASVYGLDGPTSGGGARSDSVCAAGVVSADRSSSSGRVLRCLEDDDDDLALALADGGGMNPAIVNSYGGTNSNSRPITRTATTTHGGGGRMSVNPALEERGVYMPIFLCRRCRADGRGGMSYDVERQQLFRGKQPHNHHASTAAAGGADTLPLTARQPNAAATEVPPPPPSPVKPNAASHPPTQPAQPRLPYLPVASPRALQQSHGGGMTQRPAYQRHWHSSSKGVYVGRRHDLVYQ